MYHYHFQELNSTQDFIINLFQDQSSRKKIGNDSSVLVTCDKQTAGTGRKGNQWEFLDGSLAMSCSLKLEIEPQGFISLWCALKAAEFFSTKTLQHISVKWPNDLYCHSLDTGPNLPKKCGGLIIQQKQNITLLGIGINCGHEYPENFDYGFLKLKEKMGGLAQSFYQWLSQEAAEKKNFSTQIINDLFAEKCLHHQKIVKLIDGEEIASGECIGLDQFGGILIKNSQSKVISPYYNGTLLLKGLHF